MTMYGDHIDVYHTPEAHAEGRKFERLRIIEISEDGILAHKGSKNTVFLPWEYLKSYSYNYR